VKSNESSLDIAQLRDSYARQLRDAEIIVGLTEALTGAAKENDALRKALAAYEAHEKALKDLPSEG